MLDPFSQCCLSVFSREAHSFIQPETHAVELNNVLSSIAIPMYIGGRMQQELIAVCMCEPILWIHRCSPLRTGHINNTERTWYPRGRRRRRGSLVPVSEGRPVAGSGSGSPSQAALKQNRRAGRTVPTSRPPPAIGTDNRTNQPQIVFQAYALFVAQPVRKRA